MRMFVRQGWRSVPVCWEEEVEWSEVTLRCVGRLGTAGGSLKWREKDERGRDLRCGGWALGAGKVGWIYKEGGRRVLGEGGWVVVCCGVMMGCGDVDWLLLGRMANGDWNCRDGGRCGRCFGAEMLEGERRQLRNLDESDSTTTSKTWIEACRRLRISSKMEALILAVETACQ
jgi:hypothetical protein